MRKIVIAVTGASGAIYAERLIKKLNGLKKQFDECCVVFSDNALDIWKYEIGKNPGFKGITIYKSNDFYAPFASGSGGFDTMIIIPCSMGTLGRIANGISNDLISRTADVMLKERKKLICVVRETPYNLIHINNMKTVTEAGGIICPATPSFYSKPQTIEQLVDTVIERILDLAGFEQDAFRWGK